MRIYNRYFRIKHTYYFQEYEREKFSQPSGFVAKLRKHLRTRRLTSLRQLGSDRVIVLSFVYNADEPDKSYHLVFEFFGVGNVILLDGHYKIMAVLKVFKTPGDDQQNYEVGTSYSMAARERTNHVTKEELDSFVQDSISGVHQEEVQEEESQNDSKAKKKFKSKNNVAKMPLKKALSKFAGFYGTILIEDCLRRNEIDPSMLHSDFIVLAKEDRVSVLHKLVNAFEMANRVWEERSNIETVKGYLFAKEIEYAGIKEEKTKLIYEDFQPFLPLPETMGNMKMYEFDTFNYTVDKYFSSIESMKIEGRYAQQEMLAVKKIESARSTHEKRIQGLQQIQSDKVMRAEAIEANIGLVDECIDAITELVNEKVDWYDVEKIVEGERMRGNVVAQTIKSMNLKEGKFTLTLRLNDSDSDNDSEMSYSSSSSSSSKESSGSDNETSSDKKKTIDVEIDFNSNAYKNAALYYSNKKLAAAKEERTLDSSSKALKNTERRVQKDLKRNLKNEKMQIKPLRKHFWFEKFLWFITSEGYLVIGGRDAQQNELIVRRHLRKGDVYVHVDLEGASSVVVKNFSSDAPLPPGTLNQAGIYAVSTSNAWESKQVISSFWVFHNQVSKKAPSGDILPVGRFFINGKKNYLPPSPLILGFSVLFIAGDDATKERHVKSRVHLQNDSNATSTISNNGDEVGKEEEDADFNERYKIDTVDKYNLEAHGDDNTPDWIVKESKKLKEKEEARKVKKNDHKAPEEDSLPNEAAENLLKTLSLKESTKKPRGKKVKGKKKTNYDELDDDEKELYNQIMRGGKQQGGLNKSQEQIDEENKRSNEELREQKRQKALQKQQEVFENEVKKTIDAQENEMLDEEENDSVKPLESFIANPTKEDILSDIVFVCAPYNSLMRSKYRIKVQPGTTKKGKAASSAINVWMQSNKGNDSEIVKREVELMKSFKDVELVQPIGVSRVRITVPDTKGKKK